MEELQLDKLLSEENLSTLNKLLSIFSEAENKYGLLSLVEGAVSDEELIGKVLNSVVTDTTLNLLQKWNNITKMLETLSDEETLGTLLQTLDLMKLLNKSGILDPIKGILQDEDTLGKVMSALVNDDTLNLLSNWNNILKLLEVVSREDVVNNISELMGLYNKLKSLGLIDVLKGITEDEDTIGKVMNGIINDFTMNLLAHWNEIVNDLSKFDLTNFKYYTLLINETGEALKEEKIEKITHWWQLLGLLKDPEIQVGLGVVIAVLRHIGKYHMKYIVQNGTTTTS
ncbi:DUF1641 domain-containing protein [Sulfurisphaera tokodaii]|uniref:DUF1641 domain-containing protein n=2 Tax=Sulfurisphaera tokodaii TaxID=111955 RepID=Q96XN2_SULTO|nr:DUF1641 domain-containing protein [Sulfurisphaera tokodaii]BAB67595.1 hypothetical protein STK_24870 [Sulfurisphaera tokodaii str. 7]